MIPRKQVPIGSPRECPNPGPCMCTGACFNSQKRINQKMSENYEKFFDGSRRSFIKNLMENR